MSEETNKIAENGALGESMCATFLMERFWVLKRSVDINGGDLLIQLRNSSSKFTDLLPPRIGTVQSKYSQDCHTTHYIKKEYVVGFDDEPLSGFFLIIHMGKGSNLRRFLLSSSEIAEHLPTTVKNESTYYIVGAKAYSDLFETKSNEAAQDKIENALTKRSEADRRKFLQSVSIPDYVLPQSEMDYGAG